jgi:hypothetical protein
VTGLHLCFEKLLLGRNSLDYLRTVTLMHRIVVDELKM